MILASIIMIVATQAQSSNTQIPNTVSCNDLFWNSPNEIKGKLSLKEECWLSRHRTEKNSGVLGDKMWFRTEGKYFSVSKSRLRASFSDEAKATKALQIEFQRQYRNWKRNN